MSAMTDEEFEEFLNMPVRIRFWVCPVVEHRDRRDTQDGPVATVEWDNDGIAHCLTPGCEHTSAPKPKPGNPYASLDDTTTRPVTVVNLPDTEETDRG